MNEGGEWNAEEKNEVSKDRKRQKRGKRSKGRYENLMEGWRMKG